MTIELTQFEFVALVVAVHVASSIFNAVVRRWLEKDQRQRDRFLSVMKGKS